MVAGLDLITFATVLGGLSACVYLIAVVRRWWQRRRSNTITWSQIETCLRKAMKKMSEQDFQPDYIIGCGRGGAIMAAVLSGNLPPKEVSSAFIPFAVITCEYEWGAEGGSNLHRKIKAIHIPIIPPDARNILLTITAVNTGETIFRISEMLHQKMVETNIVIKTLAIIKYPHSNLTPNYYEYEQPHLPVMPWEISRNYRSSSKPPGIYLNKS